MMRYFHFLALLSFATPVAAQEAAGRILTLAEALRAARKNQPQLLEAHAAADAALARVDEARAPLLPQVSGNATYQRSTGNFVAPPGSVPAQLFGVVSKQQVSWNTFNYFTFGVSANQLVYDFGYTTSRWAAAKASAAAQAEAERGAWRQVSFGVRAAYFQARAQKALLRVAQQTLENQERHLKQIESFVEYGKRPEIDLAQGRTDLANAEVQLVNASNAYETSKARLNQAIGVEAGTDYEVADAPLAAVPGEDASLDALLTEAFKGRSELGEAQEEIRAQELALRSVRGAYFPSLGLAVGANDAGEKVSNLTWNAAAQVTLSWALFKGGLTGAQAGEAEAGLAGLRAKALEQRQQVRLEVEEARLAVRAAKASRTAAEKALVSAKEQLRLAEGRYEAGSGNVVELGDAQLALTHASAQEVQADFTLSTARAQLLNALGRM